jgi:hypothetical protein
MPESCFDGHQKLDTFRMENKPFALAMLAANGDRAGCLSLIPTMTSCEINTILDKTTNATFLQKACELGESAIVKVLLENGASTVEVSTNGTSWNAACKRSVPDIAIILADYITPSSHPTAIFSLMVSSFSSTDTIAILDILFHNNIEAWCEIGRNSELSFLHLAVSTGRLDLIRYFLHCGFDEYLRLPDNFGSSPLQLAESLLDKLIRKDDKRSSKIAAKRNWWRTHRRTHNDNDNEEEEEEEEEDNEEEDEGDDDEDNEEEEEDEDNEEEEEEEDEDNEEEEEEEDEDNDDEGDGSITLSNESNEEEEEDDNNDDENDQSGDGSNEEESSESSHEERPTRPSSSSREKRIGVKEKGQPVMSAELDRTNFPWLQDSNNAKEIYIEVWIFSVYMYVCIKYISVCVLRSICGYTIIHLTPLPLSPIFL